ncbi:hypothetical protein V8G54_025806 [Vigna mungo]|uniref:Uncharacterized protein n=1 Tax=Vigna mungo TaxID=3915 RepID=A0AAQ3MZB9_VIGMU
MDIKPQAVFITLIILDKTLINKTEHGNSLSLGHFGYFAYFIWPFFKKTITAISRQPSGKKSEFLHRIGIGTKFSSPKDHPLNVEVTKIKCADAEEACNINITLTSPG